MGILGIAAAPQVNNESPELAAGTSSLTGSPE